MTQLVKGGRLLCLVESILQDNYIVTIGEGDQMNFKM